MGAVIPTYENFVYWYNQYKSKKCTYKHARQMVGFKHTTWYCICRDYTDGLDVTKYFKRWL